jgi:hypothetical protein
VLKQLNEGLKKALKDPDFVKKQEALGALVVTDNRIDAGRTQGIRCRRDWQD